ncbi:MAG: helix-turn-helix transcriptional regulator [Chloroflexi bacterium]|nr:helix-turn-helix transcriptional regulator [Chloroflexota bacterium]
MLKFLVIRKNMGTEQRPLVLFLKELMRRRKLLPSQLAAELGISHATVSRWLSGRDLPSVRSCQKLAKYSGVPLTKVLAAAGYLPMVHETGAVQWPEFREYAREKYAAELDDDLITMIEDLIERRRSRGYDSKADNKSGKIKK